MGPSGSGKTTFIGVLSGLDRPDEGRSVEGRRRSRAMARESGRTLRRTDDGRGVPELRPAPDALALENVELPLRLRGVAAR